MRVASYSPYGIHSKDDDALDVDINNTDRISDDLNVLDIGLSIKENNYDAIRRSSTRRLSWCVTVGNLADDGDEGDTMKVTSKDDKTNKPNTVSPKKERSKRSRSKATETNNSSPDDVPAIKSPRTGGSDLVSVGVRVTKRSLSAVDNVLAHLDNIKEDDKVPAEPELPARTTNNGRKRALANSTNTLLNMFQ